MRLEHVFESIDSHTFGAITSVIVAGVPHIPGKTMGEKMLAMQNDMDWIRTSMFWEPRGGDMTGGAILMDPCDPRADYGVLYMHHGGYMPMCGSQTIGVVTTLIEAGYITAREPETVVRLDTPAGLVEARAVVENGRCKSVSFQNIPCFLYKTSELDFGEFGPVEVDVAYGGNAFAIVRAEPFGLQLMPGNTDEMIRLGRIVLEKANAEIGFQHPEKPFINEVDQVHWYCDPILDNTVNTRSAIVNFPKLVDRSPCGTGTSAHACTRFAKGQLKLNESFSQESLTGGKFIARVIKPYSVGGCKGGIPELTGSAHITGFRKFIITPEDPLKYGFEV